MCNVMSFVHSNMNSDTQVHPVRWRCGRSVGREYELSDGWQQDPHSSQWRTDPFTESLRPTVWGFSEFPNGCQQNTFLYTFLPSIFQSNNVRKLYHHRLEICSMLPLLLFPAVGWFLLTPKTCDTPHSGRDGWPTDLTGYEKNDIHYGTGVLAHNLLISQHFFFFF